MNQPGEHTTTRLHGLVQVPYKTRGSFDPVSPIFKIIMHPGIFVT